MEDQKFLLDQSPHISVESSEGKDRRFDPMRCPALPSCESMVAEVIGRVEVAEKRVRKRKERDQRAFEDTIRALVCDLAYALLKGDERPTRLELSKRDLSASRRRADFMTESFPATVTLLCHPAVGLLELDRAKPGTYGKRQSTIRWTTGFASLVETFGVTLTAIQKAQAPVELRGSKQEQFAGGQWQRKAPRLDWPDTDEARSIEEQMRGINQWLASADIDLFVDPSKRVDLSDRGLKRIFNEGTLALGGRLYGGFWQSLSGEDRLECICLNDEGLVGLDFGQTGIRMAYAEVGAVLPGGDLYAIPAEAGCGAIRWTDYRDEVKAVMNALLSSDEDIRRFPKGARGRIPKHVPFDRLLDDILRYHAPIAGLFGGGRGLQMMRKESDVLVDVLIKLKDHGVHALPVHDGIYVAESHCDLAKTVMESSFARIVGVEASVSMERIDISPDVPTPQ